MRKLFRMRHEPCAGTCYEWDDVMKIGSLADEDREFLLSGFETLHAKTCGDQRFGFGLDLDEETGRFIGSVIAPGRMDLCSDNDLVACARKLLTLASSIMRDCDAPRTDLSTCDHGGDGEFRRFWQRASFAQSRALV